MFDSDYSHRPFQPPTNDRVHPLIIQEAVKGLREEKSFFGFSFFCFSGMATDFCLSVDTPLILKSARDRHAAQHPAIARNAHETLPQRATRNETQR